MIYTIETNQKINWYSKGTNRILQNISNLMNTNIYEVAYMRLMGLTRKYIDNPINSAGIVTAEVINLISNYEPRAKVISVNFKNIDDDNNLNFEVVVDI